MTSGVPTKAEWKAREARMIPVNTAVPAKPGQWRCRHSDRPDLFDELGRWREGVDRMAITKPA